MTGLPKQTVPGPTRTRREPETFWRNSRFLPRYRAVARSRRSHRNQCLCRVTNRLRSSLPLVCWGPASHRFRSDFCYVRPRQKPSGWSSCRVIVRWIVLLECPFDPRLFAPRFRLLSEHSSLMGRRGYALVSLSLSPKRRNNRVCGVRISCDNIPFAGLQSRFRGGCPLSPGSRNHETASGKINLGETLFRHR